jgi:hypothetical protein
MSEVSGSPGGASAPRRLDVGREVAVDRRRGEDERAEGAR